MIKHTNGYETAYAHLVNMSVEKGNNVKKGEVIGGVGSSGLSTGPHLHYEVKKDGTHVNPENYY